MNPLLYQLSYAAVEGNLSILTMRGKTAFGLDRLSLEMHDAAAKTAA